MSVLSHFYHALRRPRATAAVPSATSCPVCGAPAPLLDVVDFNKNCEEARGLKLPVSGIPVRYHLCDRCGFCFAPELHAWSFARFEEKIYNADYVAVDPDYRRERPVANAALVDQLFGKARVTHLDYGGGSGLLSETLQAKGWNSRTYDPFVDRTTRIEDLGVFDLVTAFEVFEHVPDVDRLFADLQALVKADGLILFSTLLSDGEIRRAQPLRWWYAAPRNGHISLFSKESLRQCLSRRGFNSASASSNLHLAYRRIPSWATHVLAPA